MNLLNEEKSRMQKLAGILTENWSHKEIEGEIDRPLIYTGAAIGGKEHEPVEGRLVKKNKQVGSGYSTEEFVNYWLIRGGYYPEDAYREIEETIGENSELIKEEEYDFIRDFKAMHGREPSRHEVIHRLINGASDEESEPAVTYPQGEDGMFIGDMIRNKRTGAEHELTKEPYHKRVWDEYEWVGTKAISFKDESGKEFWGKYKDYEKVSD